MEYDGKPIGEMNYRNLGNGITETGIKICDFSKQEKGLGRILLSMLFHSLFHEYHYKKIILNTNLNNTRAQHVYELIGFKQTKIAYDSWRNQNGELQSQVCYELTEHDFTSYAM